ncbi:MAG: type IV secretory system conjugative DNA transfer family protein [Alphaproteobacteria bacterium]
MALDQKKYEHKHESILRDIRPLAARMADSMVKSSNSAFVFIAVAACFIFYPPLLAFADLIMLLLGLYFWWLVSRDRSLAFKLPMGSPFKDWNNGRGGKPGKAEGILYLGNVENTNEETWFTNSDARTHVLYLGTTGAGKTEGLKSMVSNALCWGSGFVYVDGKADTDLWSSLSSLVRRLGRDDDLLVLNYMTGNSDAQAPSNTMNPFSSGSASYLTNMLVQLMPEAEGDNAMWKERAVSLASAMLPVLTWKRDNQDMQMSVRTIRDYLALNNVIKLSRDQAVPEELKAGLHGYLDTLPGFSGDAYDDEGNVKPPDGSGPPPDTTTANQQHGYLAMQFTRALQSLGDDYGYIFDTQAADVDMVDVVLNRRILVVLIPALEKSGDEIANLGKIVAATMKGMMGSALGSTVEGSSATVIENKPTHSATPFMTVFDEVGYYTAQGMAVMAAQARSLGFCLVFSGQDIPAMKKRVREEANSILANCNIKIFGKLEDPTETKEFFEKTVGSAMVTEVSGFQMTGGTEMGSYFDTQQAGIQLRPRAQYEDLRGFMEGQAVITFGDVVVDCAMFYSNPGFAKAMRVIRFMALPPTDEDVLKHASSITKLRDLLVNKNWTAKRADVDAETPAEIEALAKGFRKFKNNKDIDPIEKGIAAIVEVHAINNKIEEAPAKTETPTAPATAPAAPVTPPPAATTAPPPETQSPPPESTTEGGPMGFFSGSDKAETPSTPPTTTPPPAATAPITPPPTETPSPETRHPKPKKLPPEIEDIIAGAAKDAKKSIFKDDENA